MQELSKLMELHAWDTLLVNLANLGRATLGNLVGTAYLLLVSLCSFMQVLSKCMKLHAITLQAYRIAYKLLLSCAGIETKARDGMIYFTNE